VGKKEVRKEANFYVSSHEGIKTLPQLNIDSLYICEKIPRNIEGLIPANENLARKVVLTVVFVQKFPYS